MKPSKANQILFSLGWTPGLLARATGLPLPAISKILNGHRRTQHIQQAIELAVRSGYDDGVTRIPARYEMAGWKIFGADWFACDRRAS